MSQCLRIMGSVKKDGKALKEFIAKNAQKHNLEGDAQVLADSAIRITICGLGPDVELFVDALQKEAVLGTIISEIEIEPILKEKDYRGVFRIIE